jgi:precorrin-2 dehydrogenase/sirohydrochlorin ferrochelatase
MNTPTPDFSGNLLFPIFLRMDKLRILVVGGGLVGTEKILAIYKSSPNAKVTLVAPEISHEIIALRATCFQLTLVQKPFDESDLHNMDVVIAATNIKTLNSAVKEAAKTRKILVNVADTPDDCDFYLGSIVKKGDLKFAISTNGKSPTFAKRLRETFEEILPASIQSILDNLSAIRQKMKGDFNDKVEKLNELTSVLRKSDHEEKI